MLWIHLSTTFYLCKICFFRRGIMHSGVVACNCYDGHPG